LKLTGSRNGKRQLPVQGQLGEGGQTCKGESWRFDETYGKVKGRWKYLYRAVDKAGATVDFVLTAKRDCKAALRFFAQDDRAAWRAGEDHAGPLDSV
jgi:transposase-like protein